MWKWLPATTVDYRISRAPAQAPCVGVASGAALDLVLPAANAERRFGRWVFLEMTGPLSAQSGIKEFLAALPKK